MMLMKMRLIQYAGLIEKAPIYFSLDQMMPLSKYGIDVTLERITDLLVFLLDIKKVLLMLRVKVMAFILHPMAKTSFLKCGTFEK